MDPRREARAIHRHFARYHKDIGESVIWYRFDATRSSYDRVYDEGYRVYHRGIKMPVLWVDQTEAVEDYAPEGRRPTQRVRFAVSSREMFEAGISITEGHFNRLQDNTTADSEIWRTDRVHDIIYYDGRYFEVSAYQIRGRLKGEDVVIGVACIESFPGDDQILDSIPGTEPYVLSPDPRRSAVD